MAWEGVDSRWEGEGGEPAGSVVDAALVVDGASAATFGAEVTQRALDGGVAEIDFDHKLWWKRKPKAIKKEEAQAAFEPVARAIVAKAIEHAEQPASKAYRRADVAATITHQLPGFDWTLIYDEAYSRAIDAAIRAALDEQARRIAVREIARIRGMQDEEELALLAHFI